MVSEIHTAATNAYVLGFVTCFCGIVAYLLWRLEIREGDPDYLVSKMLIRLTVHGRAKTLSKQRFGHTYYGDAGLRLSDAKKKFEKRFRRASTEYPDVVERLEGMWRDVLDFARWYYGEKIVLEAIERDPGLLELHVGTGSPQPILVRYPRLQPI